MENTLDIAINNMPVKGFLTSKNLQFRQAMTL
jgi:hypothetical protein